MFKKGDRVHSIKPVGEKRITGAIGIVVMHGYDHPYAHDILVRFSQYSDIGGWLFEGQPHHWWCNESELALITKSPMEQDLWEYLREELR